MVLTTASVVSYIGSDRKTKYVYDKKHVNKFNGLAKQADITMVDINMQQHKRCIHACLIAEG